MAIVKRYDLKAGLDGAVALHDTGTVGITLVSTSQDFETRYATRIEPDKFALVIKEPAHARELAGLMLKAVREYRRQTGTKTLKGARQ